MHEDVTDIVLNIKSLALRMHGEGPKRISLVADGPCEVTAAMIETGHDIEVLNPELVICTMDDGAHLSMEMTVEAGKGYVPVAAERSDDAPIGSIPVDAFIRRSARSPTRWKTPVSARLPTMTNCPSR